MQRVTVFGSTEAQILLEAIKVYNVDILISLQYIEFWSWGRGVRVGWVKDP